MGIRYKWTIKSPLGKIYEIDNLKHWAENNKELLPDAYEKFIRAFKELKRGRKNNYCGWELLHYEETSFSMKQLPKEEFRYADLTCLTKRQRQAVEKYISGKEIEEISAEMECSKQNVIRLLKYASESINGKLHDKSGPRYDYSELKEYDLSKLSGREKQIVELKMQGISSRGIAHILKCSNSTVSRSFSAAMELLKK